MAVDTTFAPAAVVDVIGPTSVAVTNTYSFKPGGLVVTKVVAGDGANLRGSITINAVCDGTSVGSVTYPPDATLDPLVVSPLVAGASCTVTETANGAIPGVVDVSTVITPSPVTIPAGGNASVTVTNTYTSVLASLTVVKATAGADEFRGSITIAAECTTPADDVITESRTYPPRAPLPPLVVGGLPLGTVCVVTEPENGSTPALTVTTTPTLPHTVTIGARETVTITNTYAPTPGALVVDKQITGSMAGQQDPIQVTATCAGTTTTLDIPAGATTTPPLIITGLPAGTSCVIAEPLNGDTPTLVVTTTPTLPQTVTVPAGGAATATVTNQYEPAPATITVTKTITGPAAAEHGLIALFVDCGPQHRALLIVSPGDTTPQPPISVTGIPAPATCTVLEFLDGSTDTVQVTTTGLGPVALAPGANVTVPVTNDYQFRPGRLVLTKVITGDGAALHGQIVITATCGDEDFVIPAGVTDPAPFALEVPPGSTCIINEPTDGSNALVTVSTTPDLPRTVGPFPAGGTIAASITDEYTRRTGRLVVTKNISGPAAEFRGAITLNVACGNEPTGSITIPAGAPPTPLAVGPIPLGTQCTVREPMTGAIGDVVVDGPVFSPGSVVTIDQPLDARHRRQHLQLRDRRCRASQGVRRPSRRRPGNHSHALDL